MCICEDTFGYCQSPNQDEGSTAARDPGVAGYARKYSGILSYFCIRSHGPLGHGRHLGFVLQDEFISQ